MGAGVLFAGVAAATTVPALGASAAAGAVALGEALVLAAVLGAGLEGAGELDGGLLLTLGDGSEGWVPDGDGDPDADDTSEHE